MNRQCRLRFLFLSSILIGGCTSTYLQKDGAFPPEETFQGEDISFATLAGEEVRDAEFISLGSDALMYRVKGEQRSISKDSLAWLTKEAGSGVGIGFLSGAAAGVLTVKLTEKKGTGTAQGTSGQALQGLNNATSTTASFIELMLGGLGGMLIGGIVGGAIDQREQYILAKEITLPISEEELNSGGSMYSVSWGGQMYKINRWSAQVKRDSGSTRITVPVGELVR